MEPVWDGDTWVDNYTGELLGRDPNGPGSHFGDNTGGPNIPSGSATFDGITIRGAPSAVPPKKSADPGEDAKGKAPPAESAPNPKPEPTPPPYETPPSVGGAPPSQVSPNIPYVPASMSWESLSKAFESARDVLDYAEMVKNVADYNDFFNYLRDITDTLSDLWEGTQLEKIYATAGKLYDMVYRAKGPFVTNPYGRRGSPQHEAIIVMAEKNLAKAGYRTIAGGYDLITGRRQAEISIRIGNQKFFPDLVAMNQEGQFKYVNVGRTTAKNDNTGLPIPIIRERIVQDVFVKAGYDFSFYAYDR